MSIAIGKQLKLVNYVTADYSFINQDVSTETTSLQSTTMSSQTLDVRVVNVERIHIYQVLASGLLQ